MPSRDDLEPGSAVEGLIARFAADPSLNKPSKAEAPKEEKPKDEARLAALVPAPAPAPVPAPAPAPAPTPKPVVAAKNPYQPTAARVAPVRIRNPQRILERRAFSSGLFDCGTSECLAVVCCLPITTAQLFSKFFGGGSQPVCVLIAVLLFVGAALPQLSEVEVITGSTELLCDNTCAFTRYCDDGGPNSYYSYCDLGTDCDDCGPREVDVVGPTPLLPNALASITPILGMAASLFTFFTVCQVRAAIRKRDAIPETTCEGSGCEDCLYSCFCLPCTQCQILRHETKDKYSLMALV